MDELGSQLDKQADERSKCETYCHYGIPVDRDTQAQALSAPRGLNLRASTDQSFDLDMHIMLRPLPDQDGRSTHAVSMGRYFDPDPSVISSLPRCYEKRT